MTIAELPMDLVEEILCFVPAASLKRLRPTCKRLNRLTKDNGRFARKHFEKAAKQFEILMLTQDYMICPLRVNLHGISPSVEVKSELCLVDPHSNKYYSAQFDIDRVVHCDGLLLCTQEEESNRIVVWNPLTGETRGINVPEKYRFFCLGYDNKSCYKILSYNIYSTDFEIYEFKYDSWRKVLNAPGGASGWRLGNCSRSVSLKGNIYMFAFDDTETPRSLSLLKFDFSTEKSLLVPLPYKCHYFEATSLCAVREEKLCVLLRRDESCKTEIWVSDQIDETTKVLSWSKVLALDLSVDLQISDLGSFLLDEEKKVVMCCDRWMDEMGECKDTFYIVGEDNKVTIVNSRLDTYNQSWPAILYYVPSLVQIEQAGGKRKRVESILDITKQIFTIEAEMKILDPLKIDIRCVMSILEKAKDNLVDRLRELEKPN